MLDADVSCRIAHYCCCIVTFANVDGFTDDRIRHDACSEAPIPTGAPS